MALVPYRVSGPAADQQCLERFFQFGHISITIRQQPRLSGASRQHAQQQQADPHTAALTEVERATSHSTAWPTTASNHIPPNTTPSHQSPAAAGPAASPAASSAAASATASAASPAAAPAAGTQAQDPSKGACPSDPVAAARPKPDLSHVGLVVWESAFVLADYLLRHPPYRQWCDVNVVDLGSGTGLLGIALGKAGAHVVLTDLPHITPLTSDNVAANCGAACPSVRVAHLDWTNRQDCTQYQPDLITGSDLLYDVTMFDHLALTIAALCEKNRHCVAYLAYRTRDGSERGFEQVVERLGFVVRHVGSEQLHDDYRSGGHYHVMKLCLLD